MLRPAAVLVGVTSLLVSCRSDESPTRSAKVPGRPTAQEGAPPSPLSAALADARFAGIPLFTDVDTLIANHGSQLALKAIDASNQTVWVIGPNGERHDPPADAIEYTGFLDDDVLSAKFESQGDERITTVHLNPAPGRSRTRFEGEAARLAERLGPPTDENEAERTWCVEQPELLCIDMWTRTSTTVARRWGPPTTGLSAAHAAESR